MGRFGWVVLGVMIFIVFCNGMTLPTFVGDQKEAKNECGWEVTQWDLTNISQIYSYDLHKYVNTPEEEFPIRQQLTIMIPTIPSHTDELRETIQNHYSHCRNIHKILWLWDSSEPVTQFFQKSNYITTPPPHGNLVARFNLVPEIETDHIMSLDDDLLVDCQAISAGLKILIDNPSQYVSFYPRLLSCDWGSIRYIWDGSYRTKAYNLGLTNAAIVHRSSIQSFWDHQNKYYELFEMVQVERNCEDLLFAFIHWEVNKHPSVIIYWEGHSKMIDRPGLSSRAGHAAGRDKCIQAFVQKFGFVPGRVQGGMIDVKNNNNVKIKSKHKMDRERQLSLREKLLGMVGLNG